MANWYVSVQTGNDSTGTGSLAAPWKTIAKAMASVTPSGGDTIYFAPGTYRETSLNVFFTPSAANPVTLVGDFANSQGFAGVAAGPVVWTNYTTDYKTTPASTLLGLNGQSYLTFQSILFIGGGIDPSIIDGRTTNTNITFQQCGFIGNGAGFSLISITAPANTTLTWLFDRCLFLGLATQAILVSGTLTGATADWDVGLIVQNCKFLGGFSGDVKLTTSGSGTFKPGGGNIKSCWLQGGSALITGANWATSIPAAVANSVVLTHSSGINAGASGNITEDYNWIGSPSPRTNVTAGAHSQTAYAPMFEVGMAEMWGMAVRPYGVPMDGSPMLGFGNLAGAPTVDLLGRPRPAGGQSAANSIGCYERHDTATQSASADADGGTGAAWLQTGPSDDELEIPVDATSTTISIKCKYDGSVGGNTYGTANGLPQVMLLARGEIGVTAQTLTATTAANGVYEAKTFAPITPTAKGKVVLRLVNRDSNGTGKVWWDTISIS